MPNRYYQQGGALLLTLTLVSILTVIATELYALTRENSARFASVQSLEQAQWFALSGEQHSFVLAKQLFDKPVLSATAKAANFPISHGNLTIKLQPLHNCFNINSLDTYRIIEQKSQPNPDQALAIKAFRRLLQLHAIDALKAKTLTSRLVDWIDTDSTPIDQFGLERAGTNTAEPTNGHLHNIEEIKQLGVLTDAEFQALQPDICARLGDTSIALNPNDLNESHSRILSALVDGQLDESQLKQVLQAMPADGYSSVESFVQELQTEKHTLSTELNTAFSLERFYYQTNIQVLYDRSRIKLHSLFVTDGKTSHTLSRY